MASLIWMLGSFCTKDLLSKGKAYPPSRASQSQMDSTTAHLLPPSLVQLPLLGASVWGSRQTRGHCLLLGPFFQGTMETCRVCQEEVPEEQAEPDPPMLQD